MNTSTMSACAALLLCGALNACASGQTSKPQPQVPEKGAYIARIGKDTLAVETYERTPTRLTGRSILRAKTIMVRDYTMDFAPDGSVARYDLLTYPLRLVDGAVVTDSASARQQTYVYHGDSATVTLRDRANTRTIPVSTPANALPFSENTFVTWQEAIRRAKPGRELSFVAGGNPLRYTVERPAARKMVLSGVSNDFGPMIIALDEQGRMTQLDMRATTDKYLVDRVDALDLNTLATQFAAHPLGPLSPRDTAVVHVQTASGGVANVSVDYSKPSMRGRVVFGDAGMQHWGDVWRLGADQATQLITDRDIEVGGFAVPAGTYSLWVIPAQTGDWTFIINKQHGQWGTVYDAKQDLARIPVHAKALTSPVETLDIQILAPDPQNSALVIEWERTQLSIPIRWK